MGMESKGFSSINAGSERKLSQAEVDDSATSLAYETASSLSDEELDAKIAEINAEKEGRTGRSGEIYQHIVSISEDIQSRLDAALSDSESLSPLARRNLKELKENATTPTVLHNSIPEFAQSIVTNFHIYGEGSIPEGYEKIMDQQVLDELLERQRLTEETGRKWTASNPYVLEKEKRAGEKA